MSFLAWYGHKTRDILNFVEVGGRRCPERIVHSAPTHRSRSTSHSWHSRRQIEETQTQHYSSAWPPCTSHILGHFHPIGMSRFLRPFSWRYILTGGNNWIPFIDRNLQTMFVNIVKYRIQWELPLRIVFDSYASIETFSLLESGIANSFLSVISLVYLNVLCSIPLNG